MPNSHAYPLLSSAITKQAYELKTPNIIIGRNPACPIPLLHQSISKEHSIIKYNPLSPTTTLQILDLGSINGTYVNSLRISNEIVFLKPNDQIKFGKDSDVYTVTFQYQKQESTQSPPSSRDNDKQNNNNKYNPLFKPEESHPSDTELKYKTLLIDFENLQRVKEKQEVELKFQEETIGKYKNSDTFKIIDQKDRIISILQNELNVYKQKLPNYTPSPSNTFHAKNQTFIGNNGKDQYEIKISNLDLKLKELKSENASLISIIKQLQDKHKEYEDNINKKIIDNDSKIYSLIEKIPTIDFNFNIQKENAAKFLVEQVKKYLSEKEEILLENAKVKNHGDIGTTENERGRKENENMKMIYTIHINEGNKKIENIINSPRNGFFSTNINNSTDQSIGNPNTMEKYGGDAQDNLSRKEREIHELQCKLQAYQGGEGHFDNKEIVNKISGDGYNKDVQIYNGKQSLNLGKE